MIIKLSKPLNLFVLTLSATVMLAFIPQQVDARGGNRGGGGKAQSSVNRGGNKGGNNNKNTNKNTNRNTNKNVNNNTNVNRNVNKNVNVDVDVNHRGGCCGRGYHPVATGVAVAATVAVIGSIVYTLPSNCTTIVTSGISYRQCGSTWYQPSYSGSDVTYVVVNAP